MSTRHDEMRAKALEFHQAHPEVWRLFQRFTLEMINRGLEHYSAKGIFERIRWETAEAKVNTEKEFKLNNNYSPFYARGFMDKYPQHAGFFRTRKQISKDACACNLPPLGPGDYPTQTTKGVRCDTSKMATLEAPEVQPVERTLTQSRSRSVHHQPGLCPGTDPAECC